MTPFSWEHHCEPYGDVCWIADRGGYIVWRLGTGQNVEVLHLRAYEPGSGAGRALLREMLARLKVAPPYATVFGFTQLGNLAAQAWYMEMGFALSTVEGVYADGVAVVFSARYKNLVEKHL